MRRIFVPMENVENGEITVVGDDVNHIRDVLRAREGDEITASCGRGTNYACRIKKIEKDRILLKIDEELPDTSELPVKISLYQALPKADKMELVIQKAVELGASEIVPMRTVRSVVRLEGEKAEKKAARWRKIAEEAAKQSGRGLVPEICGVMNFDDAVNRAAESDYIVIPYELSEEYISIENIKSIIENGAKNIAVFIGSEGGFERSEVEAVEAVGGDVISLGHRILRTETAAIAVMAHIMFIAEGATAD